MIFMETSLFSNITLNETSPLCVMKNKTTLYVKLTTSRFTITQDTIRSKMYSGDLKSDKRFSTDNYEWLYHSRARWWQAIVFGLADIVKFCK